MFLDQPQRAKEKMAQYQDDAHQVQGESGPETAGIVDVDPQCDKHKADPETVFYKKVVKLHFQKIKSGGFSKGVIDLRRVAKIGLQKIAILRAELIIFAAFGRRNICVGDPLVP